MFVRAAWRLILSVAMILLAGVIGCRAAPSAEASGLQRFDYTAIRMGVEARIVLYAPNEPAAVAAAREAFNRIAELDAVLSDYRVDSELNRLCASPPRFPVRVSNDLLYVLEYGQNLARQTGGAFNLTAGPLVRLWREARDTGALPDPVAIEAARERSGWRNVDIDAEVKTVTLLQDGMQFDPGGIGKGFAADEAMRTLHARGIWSAMVALAGDIVVGDPPPGRRGWTIGLAPGLGVDESIMLANAAISTSGDLEQHVEIGGVRYSHIIDPRTGEAITQPRAVSVIAPRGIAADALATALSVLGPHDGALLLRARPDVSVLYRWREGDDIQEHRVGRFASH